MNFLLQILIKLAGYTPVANKLVPAQVPTDVTTVLATFNTVLDDLNKVAEHHNDQVSVHAEAAQAALNKKAESEDQVAQAVVAIKNIQALLGK